MYPYVVELPEGEDPDSFLLAHGKEELQVLIDKAPSLIQYMAKSTTVSPDAAERIDFLLDNIRQMSDEVRQELALQEVSEAFKISVSALSKKLASTMRRSYQTEEKEPLHAFSSIENHHEERNLLVISMQNVDDYKRLVSEVKDDYFINESYRGIFKWLRENVKPEAIESSSTLLDDIEDTQLRDALADLMFEEMQDLSFDDALKQVRIRKLQLDLEEMDRKLLNEPQNLDLFKQKQALSKEYKQLTRKVVHKIRF
jgi:DNA primase